MQDVEGLSAMLGDDGIDHLRDVALEIPAFLLAYLFEADHPDAGDLRRRTAAIDPAAKSIAAVLADHGHVVVARDQLLEQVLGIDRHARDSWEIAPADETDPHAPAARK